MADKPGAPHARDSAQSDPRPPAEVAPSSSATKSKEQQMVQASLGERDRAIKILAKSIFRELKMNGYETRQIVALSSELLGLVTTNMKPDGIDGGD
ncbi:MAG TPA: hypothetical protein PK472_08145 [Pseudomonadota bacterium]|nr:hypothetical protein [Pseudomonadota bacterium]HND10721.1 hypothetical protein [Pseudomonadota bacterium]HNN51532.1 hypothetical protein [Pseudomonadota bacterium]